MLVAEFVACYSQCGQLAALMIALMIRIVKQNHPTRICIGFAAGWRHYRHDRTLYQESY